MLTPALLEQPGKWRAAGLCIGLLLAFSAPLFLVVTHGLKAAPGEFWLGAGFGAALLRSVRVALTVAALSLLIGCPAGILAALYRFRARSLLLALLALPLLLPSFLWALGAAMLRAALKLPADGLLAGFSGTVLAFSALALPLVIFVSLAAARTISQSQADAARLAGGERTLFRYSVRSVLPIASMSALLAGTLTLTDPGPGQILGYSGAGFEILTSFSAQYDFALAARQCVAVAAVALLLSIPLIGGTARSLATGLLTRDATPVRPSRHTAAGWLGPALLLGVILLTVVLPLAGLLPPALRAPQWARAGGEIARTALDTARYTLAAALLATLLGYGLAVCAGRDSQLRCWLLVAVLALLALPPAVGALGWLHAGSSAPAALVGLLRSHWSASLHLASRGLPIAVVFALRSVGSTSPSWAQAAALHGVPLSVYFRRVLVPLLLPAAGTAALVVALFVMADVGSLILLAPPGASSLPQAIFTVMANAPESLVSSLCLCYIGGMMLVLTLGWGVAARRPFHR
ncbi:MAG: hypothetical protein ABIZ56_00175 [Chthoniobacteraceae bacterium]